MRSGRIAELDDESSTTSELLQGHLPASRFVKAANRGAPAGLGQGRL